MLTQTHLAVLRAALQFFDEELGPHGVNAMRPYFQEGLDEAVSRNDIAQLRELLRICEIRYVCCDREGTQVMHTGLFASADVARSFTAEQVATVLLRRSG